MVGGMANEAGACTWCGKELVNVHWGCRIEAASAADFQTSHGYARNRWGAKSKHPDLEWYGGQDDIEND